MKGIRRNRILTGNLKNADWELEGRNQDLSKTTVRFQRPKVGLDGVAVNSSDC